MASFSVYTCKEAHNLREMNGRRKKIALCLCTPPLNITWRCGEKTSALTASSKKIAGLRKDMMMKNNDTTVVKLCVSGFSRAKCGGMG